jgi:hypothetical protein
MREYVQWLIRYDSNHPQSTAYLIGHKAAEAIIEEWKL